MNPGVETPIGTQYVHIGLSIITLICLVDFGLRKDDQACTKLIPLELNLVAFIKCLLGDGRRELRDGEDLDGGGQALETMLEQFNSNSRRHD